MCQYIAEARALMAAIEPREAAAGTAAGRSARLAAPADAAGCYCEPPAAQHKWGLVLETIHYALLIPGRRDTETHEASPCTSDPARPLLGDGAMGTQLMLAGLEQGNCGEAWNLTHPERVLAIQRRYAEAGSDCILTNTFGGSRIMLNRHSHAR